MTYKTAEQIQKKLYILKKDVIYSIESFLRYSKTGDRFNLHNTFASNENENIEILGIAVNEEEIYLFGEDNFGEGKSASIQECSIENLLAVLVELEQKKYDQD